MKQELIKELSQTCGTPSYIFDLDAFEERIQGIRQGLGSQVALCYAMKANPFLAEAAGGLTERLEVCSPGEVRICERAGIPMERLVISGVNKQEEEIRRIIQTYEGKGTFTVESWEHLNILQKCAKEAVRKIEVLIRVTSGNQFGVDEEEVCRMIEHREEYPNIRWRGLQYYSGTQKKRLGRIEKELRRLDAFCGTLKQKYDFEVQELEYGPGLYVPYFQGEECQDEESERKELREILESMEFKGRITLEMGRYMAAYCGVYLTKIVDQKVNRGQRYAIADGGIHHLNYYGQSMAMKHPHFFHFPKEEGGEIQEWTLCGSLCTSGDVIVKQLPLQNAKVNDILVFERVGAYSVTEGMYLFLSRDLPQIYSYSEKGGLKLLREGLPTDPINSKG